MGAYLKPKVKSNSETPKQLNEDAMHRTPEPVLYLDTETYQPDKSRGIKTVGGYKYLETAELLMVSYAIGEGPVKLWDLTQGDPIPGDLLRMLTDEHVNVWAHNAMFDRNIINRTLCALGHDTIPIARWRDSMVLAMTAAYPGGLGQLSTALGMPEDTAKLKDGRRLLQKFTVPNRAGKRIGEAEDPEDWRLFRQYARQDITAMREAVRALPQWVYTGDILRLWHLDQKINDRGLPIDLDLAQKAVALVKAHTTTLNSKAKALTKGAVRTLNQGEAIRGYLNDTYNLNMKSLDKAAVSSALSRKNLPDEARDLLRLRQSAAKTSTAKYKKVLVATGEGSRLRGTLQFYGAMRTGRLAGRLFQPQNLPSRGLLNADICVPAIKKGMADLLYDDILLAASSAVRGLICAPEGRKIVFGDLAGIEARVLPWLASEEHVLEVFRSGRDIYIETAARILNKPPGEVTKFERTAYGKVPVLALGYQGGPNAFISMAANYGLDELDPAFVTGIVRGFRNRHPAIVRFWHALQNAAWDAITEPGTTHEAGRISEITVREHEGRQWLTLRLPSGRLLCYPEPDIEERTQITEKEVVVGIDQETGLQQTKKVRTRVQRAQIHFSGIDQYTRKWTRVPTYSGKLAENVTQAVAADIMLHGMESAEAQGYHVLLTVHDELVTETPDTEAYSGDELAEIMATPPEWAEGLPLAAEGDEAERYKK